MNPELNVALEYIRTTLEILGKVSKDRGNLSEFQWQEVDVFVREGEDAITTLTEILDAVEAENNTKH